MRRRPTFVSATLVFGFLRMNLFSIVTSPASSSLVRWLERFPFVSPVARWRKTKSASVTDESTVRIASRPGSWISRSRTGASLDSSMRRELGRAERADEQAVIEDAGHDHRDARQPQAGVARVLAGPDRQR